MRESKINQENFSKRPVLLFVKVIDENILDFLHFKQALLYFEDHA